MKDTSIQLTRNHDTFLLRKGRSLSQEDAEHRQKNGAMGNGSSLLRAAKMGATSPSKRVVAGSNPVSSTSVGCSSVVEHLRSPIACSALSTFKEAKTRDTSKQLSGRGFDSHCWAMSSVAQLVRALSIKRLLSLVPLCSFGMAKIAVTSHMEPGVVGSNPARMLRRLLAQSGRAPFVPLSTVPSCF